MEFDIEEMFGHLKDDDDDDDARFGNFRRKAIGAHEARLDGEIYRPWRQLGRGWKDGVVDAEVEMRDRLVWAR